MHAAAGSHAPLAPLLRPLTPFFNSLLEEFYARFAQTPFPSLPEEGIGLGDDAIEALDDIILDMALEDAKLAGLVDSFLGSDVLDEREIVLDQDIDDALAAVASRLGANVLELAQIIAYRAQMIALADALGKASGRPVVRLSSGLRESASSD